MIGCSRRGGAKDAAPQATPDTRVMRALPRARGRLAICNDLHKLTRRRRLAHWLLSWVPVLVSAGCIVPLPLEAETGPANSPPAIADGEAVPTFGVVQHVFGEQFELSVRVDDPDLDDVLVARLFRPAFTGQSRVSIYELPSLPSAGDAEHPERRVATFPNAAYCDLVTATNEPVKVSVKVSDFGFDNAFSDQTKGLTDEAYWVLICN